MSLRLVAATDGPLWDALVDANPGGTSFHGWSWLHLQSRVFGWRFEPLIAELDGQPVGVVPVVVEHGVLPHSVRPPFPYVGPLVPAPLLGPALAALRSWQLRHALPIVRIELGPDVAVPATALTDHGFETEPETTFVVPLAGRSPADLEKALSSRRRRALRQADQHGITVRPSSPGEIGSLLPRLLGEAFESRDMPSPYPDAIGVEVERWADGRDGVFATTVLLGDRPVGAQLALADQDTVYAWAGGTLREQRQADPFTVLAVDLFRWALARGHRDIDLVGRVDEGISAFKRSLGGVERPYVSASSTRVPTPALDAFRTARHAVTAIRTPRRQHAAD